MASNDNPNEKSNPQVCEICSRKFDNFSSFTDHLESTEHKKQVMKKKYGQKYLEAKALLNEKHTKNENKEMVGISNEKIKLQKCKLCKKEFGDIYSYTDHLESKEHADQIIQQKFGQKSLNDAKADSVNSETENSEKNSNSISTTKTTPNSNSESSPNSKSDEGSSSDDEDDVYTCDVCKKVCTGALSYKLHLAGNKHRKKVNQVKSLKELKEKNLFPSSYVKPDMNLMDQLKSDYDFASSGIRCEQCNVHCTGPEVYKQHCKGESHKKKVATLSLKKKMKDEGAENDDLKCDTCEKAFSGIVPFKQHMESIAHLKQLKAKQKLENIKDLYVSSPENSKLLCKECGKTFTGPGPLEEHLKSSAHDKQKKKTNLFEQLEKKHPEMIKTQMAGESDSGESDDDIRPACGICHVIFSGPEGALDHFSSSKHKKALKKKKLIEKNKALKKTSKSLHKSASVEKDDKLNAVEGTHSSEEEFEKISL